MKQPGHILIGNIHFDPDTYGGATVVAGEVARRLEARGIRVSAVAGMQVEGLAPYTMVRSRRGNIDTYRINLPPGPPQGSVHDDPEVTARVVQLARRLSPDLVHLHCLQGLGAGLIGGISALGLPVVLSVHDFWWICERQFMVRPDGKYCGQDPVRLPRCSGCVTSMGQSLGRQATLFAAAAQADLVTFPSSFARGLTLRSGLPARRAEVWENGVTAPGAGYFDLQAARRDQSRRLSFGFVGGPSSVKGWPLVRAAFQRLDRNDFDGVVVDGSLDGSWWRPAMLSGMRGDWRIHPRYDQGAGIDRFFSTIDVLLFVSQWREAFGLTVREAISRGVRVIQTAGGGASEHDGTHSSRLLPLGAGAEHLSRMIGVELEHPDDHPAPVRCRDYEEQTDDLLRLVATL